MSFGIWPPQEGERAGPAKPYSGESPRQQCPGCDIAGGIEHTVRKQRTSARWLVVLPHDETSWEGDEQSDQQEQQPPPARTEGVEPQRRKERDDHRFDQPPPDLPAVERPHEGVLAGRLIPAVSDRRCDGGKDGNWQPGAEQAAPGHPRRRAGGTYPRPR